MTQQESDRMTYLAIGAWFGAVAMLVACIWGWPGMYGWGWRF